MLETFDNLTVTTPAVRPRDGNIHSNLMYRFLCIGSLSMDTGSLNTITSLLEKCKSSERNFPPTLLYEEGWMLRLVLEWFCTSNHAEHALSFDDGSTWYSEARLASPFLPRYRGDKHAEGYTHADRAIGHFTIGDVGRAELSIKISAKQFIVAEAKMFSGLSKGTTHAPTYNQAARNVACIAELISRAGLTPVDLNSLGFYVLAPQEQIDSSVFDGVMDLDNIADVIECRARQYGAPKTDWFIEFCKPLLDELDIRCISWEEVVSFIKSTDPDYGSSLLEFYNLCLEFNRSVKTLN